MQTSEYFDLGLYEGTDIFNPLIVENENIEKIDEQMFLNSIASVGQATELKSGTVHAITRVNPDASMFRFVATSKFDRGDTFTVDGIQVTGLRTDGKALDDGAYVINANVLCCLTGTVLTLFVATGDVAKADDADRLGGELPAYYGTASDVQQAITVAQAAGVLANDLQGQVTTINSNLSNYDFSETSMTPTTFKDMIQQILNAVFPARAQGTFTPSTSSAITVDTGVKINKIRITGMLGGTAITELWDSANPNVINRTIGSSTDVVSLPNTRNNTIRSITNTSFVWGLAEGYASYGTYNYYVNE